MALTKYRLGDLIKVVDERNSFGITDFCGLNIAKEFMPTVANIEGLDERNYKVVRKGRFVFSGMQTGRDECIRIGMYKLDNPIIVSPAYTTFEVEATNIILPLYFFMLFLSKEKDRMGWFYSDGSIRSNLDWDRFCDIELSLPSLLVQQKYVDIYTAMVANQKSYERGLEDLKLVCDGHFDVAKKRKTFPLGNYIESVDRRNADGKLSVANVKGITNNKEFSETKADVGTTDLTKFKVVNNGEFAYNSRTDGRDMLVLALNRSLKSIIVTFNYGVFRIRKEKQHEILPEYLYAFFKREEFDRRVRFCSWGSSQELLSWGSLCDIHVPVPSIQEQQSIACVMDMYIQRRSINEHLKAQIKDICPILIKGSLEEEM
ncbi:MAG: restriction endonuclease subunit S [Kiritimatiellae bacterium]|nr:restriction endonuclease subunit S [Kiritimatiellia bacterium]